MEEEEAGGEEAAQPMESGEGNERRRRASLPAAAPAVDAQRLHLQRLRFDYECYEQETRRRLRDATRRVLDAQAAAAAATRRGDDTSPRLQLQEQQQQQQQHSRRPADAIDRRLFALPALSFGADHARAFPGSIVLEARQAQLYAPHPGGSVVYDLPRLLLPRPAELQQQQLLPEEPDEPAMTERVRYRPVARIPHSNPLAVVLVPVETAGRDGEGRGGDPSHSARSLASHTAQRACEMRNAPLPLRFQTAGIQRDAARGRRPKNKKKKKKAKEGGEPSEEQHTSVFDRYCKAWALPASEKGFSRPAKYSRRPNYDQAPASAVEEEEEEQKEVQEAAAPWARIARPTDEMPCVDGEMRWEEKEIKMEEEAPLGLVKEEPVDRIKIEPGTEFGEGEVKKEEGDSWEAN